MRFTAMANIFLLEDDKILSKGISIALKKDEHTVTAVYGYLEALQQYQKQKYDLFLLDINLPDGNGLEFCKKIRETSETPVLFLTANDTEEDMLEGFGVGCDDYISKPFSIEVLRKKVLAVLKRTGIGKFRMKYRDLELDKEKCVVLMKGQEIHLTSTEYKLLLYLMENRGRVVTKAMLLEQLWDIDGKLFCSGFNRIMPLSKRDILIKLFVKKVSFSRDICKVAIYSLLSSSDNPVSPNNCAKVFAAATGVLI